MSEPAATLPVSSSSASSSASSSPSTTSSNHSGSPPKKGIIHQTSTETPSKHHHVSFKDNPDNASDHNNEDNQKIPLTTCESNNHNPENGTMKSSEEDDHEVTHVSEIIGGFGFFQKKVFAFFFICGIFSAWNGLALSFYGPEIDYWCENTEWTSKNISIGAQKLEIKNTPNYVPCSDPNSIGLNLSSATCSKFIFDDSEYQSTIIQEWDLVCDKSWLVSMAKSSYMVGTLVAVLLSQVADKYGRFPVVFGGVMTEVAAGFLSAISPNIYVYLFSRFFLALGNAARWGSGFVILLELVGTKYRSDIGIGIEFGWALGYVLLPVIAYFIRDFRILQLTLTIPEIIFIYLAWIVVPESPRWQLTHGKFKSVERDIRTAAHQNCRAKGFAPDDQVIEPKLRRLLKKFQDESRDQAVSKSNNDITLFDLWKTPNLRRKTFILYLTWAVNGFVYYGLSFNTNSLEGNPYLNFALSGAVEIPAYALTLYALKRYGGRKPVLVSNMIGAGLAFLLILPFSSYDNLIWLRTSLAMVGKFFITASFAILYLYSAEIYPTVARGVGIGSSSMFARVGAIAAPFVKELGEATHVSIALAIFGFLSIFNSWILWKYAEETDGKEIPDTIYEAEYDQVRPVENGCNNSKIYRKVSKS